MVSYLGSKPTGTLIFILVWHGVSTKCFHGALTSTVRQYNTSVEHRRPTVCVGLTGRTSLMTTVTSKYAMLLVCNTFLTLPEGLSPSRTFSLTYRLHHGWLAPAVCSSLSDLGWWWLQLGSGFETPSAAKWLDSQWDGTSLRISLTSGLVMPWSKSNV